MQFASISFDIAIEEMWPTWIAGATLVNRASKALMGSSELLGWIQEQQITVLNLPTAYWHELVRELAESKRSMPESVRLVIVGGEKLRVRPISLGCSAEAIGFGGSIPMAQPKRSVIATSLSRIRRSRSRTIFPIGKPIANTEIYILNENLQAVAAGEPGELPHWRAGRRSRLPESAGDDCGEVHCRSVQEGTRANACTKLEIRRGFFQIDRLNLSGAPIFRVKSADTGLNSAD